MDANSLRRAFTDFFVKRGHSAVASAGLVPHHPTAPLFTNAGMVPIVPYFLGEEAAPWARATSVQKCVRTIDIDIIGTTSRHCTFFEMLGNFSIDDYFKEAATQMAWDFATDVLCFDGDKLWVTVHDDDDEAEQCWIDGVGLRPERVQRLGDADNFWEMQKGGTGPCGPNSELFLDRGPDYGPDGGPANDPDGERYLEFWNLVFIQYNRRPDGTLEPLGTQNVDTGAGFERNLCLLQGVDSVFETDVLRPVIAQAERATGRRYGDDERSDVSLRIMADHTRAAAFLVNDHVPPSNDERGYVVRRLIRRVVRHAHMLGVDKPIMPDLLETVVDVMGDAYPSLANDKDAVVGTIAREEDRFLATLRNGMEMLETELVTGAVKGPVAFQLHDTFGFPIELTEEIAGERGVPVDRGGFDDAMAEQRRRAKAGRKAVGGGDDPAVYRALLDEHGKTEFTGYDETTTAAKIVSVVERDDGTSEVFLDRTPFYAEGGGQIGDTGTITTSTGSVEVLDTNAPVAGLHRHLAKPVEGDIAIGQDATAAVDVERRDDIRRNHTGTHLLHWALREVLGTHVKQQGSLVHPDYLRFDFSHHGPMSTEEVAEVERLVNERVLDNAAVRADEMGKDEAEQLGAIAFFGDKYGERVRVIRAGNESMEFCGGTHVDALGTIGFIKVVSEESIGANLRRITGVTGHGTLARIAERDRVLNDAAARLKTTPEDLEAAVTRLLDRQKTLETEMRTLQAASARAEAPALAAAAVDGVVVARRDGLVQDQLRDLATAVRDQASVHAVILGGSPDGEKVALVAAVSGTGREAGFDAGALLADAAKTVGGGGSKNADLAMAGGRDPNAIDAALDAARRAANIG
ncbi:MAG TPA: alanine--tRNA ligase [Acidimicrobiales bacterium]|nr:alanine--tRNA ligase [Acidimicrobiales bacterium]